MAKKAKAKKSILASVMEQDNVVALQDSSIGNTSDASAEQIVVQENIKYDDVCNVSDELIKINSENSDLKDRLAEYLEEIDVLKLENEKLKKDYDASLIKISELSFENATLKANLDEKEKSNTILKPIEIKQSTNVPYMKQPYCNKNGYSDWN